MGLMWVARGVILWGARLGTAVHPAESKAQCFPGVCQKASGQLCFGGGLILPAGTGLGATRGLASGVVWGLQGGCRVEVAEPWRARGRDGGSWLQCCGSTLLPGVRSCWPPSLIPPALLSSLHPSLCPSLHPFSVVLPAQDVPASLSLASCQPFPTLPNPGLQPWLLMPWEQLLKSPRARATGPGP